MKIFKKILLAGLIGAIFMGNATGVCDAKKAKAETKQTTAAVEGYLYQSPLYNYTIVCPQKPAGRIPAKLFFEDNSKRGEVLIFESDPYNAYNVKYAWIILLDAFDNASIPDLNKISDEDALKMIEKIEQNNGYAAIGIVNITETNKGIYAVTAKEIEIDEDGDGEPDAVATADTQEAVTFFRGNKGGRFCVRLIDNPQLRKATVEAYQVGVSTLTETASNDPQ